jgi:tripartite-type tricarboxylate transporter receptor subunit TctC
VFYASAACGQDYPTRPIRIVTGEPGGSTDFAVRLIAQGIAGPLGQQVITDNRNAMVAQDVVIRGLADGYTLLFAGGFFWIGPLLQKMSYDPIKDFAPITLATISPIVLVVHPSVQATSVKDVIALAKAKPGVLNYGSGASGTANHLAAELFKSMVGVNIVRVPYKGAGPAATALIGGEVQMAFINIAAAAPHIKSGKVRALGVGSAQPSALLPGAPTIASTVPGYESVASQAMFAPAGTPAAIVTRLNREVVRVLNTPDMKAKMFDTGAEVVGNSPEQFAAVMKSEIARLGKVIKDAHITAE